MNQALARLFDNALVRRPVTWLVKRLLRPQRAAFGAAVPASGSVEGVRNTWAARMGARRAGRSNLRVAAERPRRAKQHDHSALRAPRAVAGALRSTATGAASASGSARVVDFAGWYYMRSHSAAHRAVVARAARSFVEGSQPRDPTITEAHLIAALERPAQLRGYRPDSGLMARCLGLLALA